MKEIKAPNYRYEFEVGYWIYYMWPEFVWGRVKWMRDFVNVYLRFKEATPHEIVGGRMRYYEKKERGSVYRVDVGGLWFYSKKRDMSLMDYMVKVMQWVEVKPNVVMNRFVCIDVEKGEIWHDIHPHPKKVKMEGYLNDWVDYFVRL